jgi:hypothetical protein
MLPVGEVGEAEAEKIGENNSVINIKKRIKAIGSPKRHKDIRTYLFGIKRVATTCSYPVVIMFL